MTTDKQLDHLIGMLYEAAMDTRLMHEALRLYGQYVDATDGVFLTVDKNDDVISVLQETWFSSQYGNSDMSQTIDISETLNMLRSATVNEWRCDLMLTKHFVDRRKYYQNSSGYQSANHTMTAWVDDNEEHRSLLALFRPVSQQPFNHDEQWFAQRFGSHFQRALRMQRQTQSLHAKSEISIRAIDVLELSMMIVNDKGIMLHLNASAERLLNNQVYGLALKPGGGLCCFNSTNNNKLTALITLATSNKPLSGAMFLNINGAGQLFVKPLPATSVFKSNCMPLALVMVVETNNNLATLQLLGKLYCLTAAELRVASALLQGKSLDEYAKEESVTINTVRSHLKILFRKTSTRRQSELVALLSKVPRL